MSLIFQNSAVSNICQVLLKKKDQVLSQCTQRNMKTALRFAMGLLVAIPSHTVEM